MRVLVEACWAGNSNYHFRCTIKTGPNKGDRFNVGNNRDGDTWSRQNAKELRDYCERRYGANRNSIKIV